MRLEIKGKAFTKREAEIIKLILDELTNSQIAEQLHISIRTVETHRKNILTKTSSKTIVGLFKFLYRNKFLK